MEVNSIVVFFMDCAQKFNIKIQTTPSYSPWSNEVCERQNQTLTSMLLKFKGSEKCDYDTALAWAVSAKNSLINHNERENQKKKNKKTKQKKR